MVDVELNALILAASQTGKPQIVERLKYLRSAWLGYSRYKNYELYINSYPEGQPFHSKKTLSHSFGLGMTNKEELRKLLL